MVAWVRRIFVLGSTASSYLRKKGIIEKIPYLKSVIFSFTCRSEPTACPPFIIEFFGWSPRRGASRRERSFFPCDASMISRCRVVTYSFVESRTRRPCCICVCWCWCAFRSCKFSGVINFNGYLQSRRDWFPSAAYRRAHSGSTLLLLACLLLLAIFFLTALSMSFLCFSFRSVGEENEGRGCNFPSSYYFRKLMFRHTSRRNDLEWT